jgi:hypothetical protein
MGSNPIADKFSQPLDRVAWIAMAILTVIIAAILLTGERTAPSVREFSWDEQQIGADDRAFIMTFSRPMNRESVEDHLKIEPPLPGKISWAGRRMAYTLDRPAPYGFEFRVTLDGARDRFSDPDDESAQIQPFLSRFRSRDRAIVYLGVEPEERGRLILYNLSTADETTPRKTILTPKELWVTDYEPYPEGDRILFSASDRLSFLQGRFEQQLYTVTTGIHPDLPGEPSPHPKPPGKIERILDSQEYQNLSFDLAPNGQIVVVQRIPKDNPGQVSLWKIEPGKAPEPLGNEPGGDFMITPDSTGVVVAQGQGLANLPLEPNAEPLDFMAQFGQILSFKRDGSAAAMVKFNTDYTRSLFLVIPAQGVQKELWRTNGSILDAQFSPNGDILYCLLTKLIPGDEYQEEPYIGAIDLNTEQLQTLIVLPQQREIQMSLSPDGLGLLFDQIFVASGEENAAVSTDLPRTSSGATVTGSRLWLLPLTGAPPAEEVKGELKPEQLPFSGLQPDWLP